LKRGIGLPVQGIFPIFHVTDDFACVGGKNPIHLQTNTPLLFVRRESKSLVFGGGFGPMMGVDLPYVKGNPRFYFSFNPYVLLKKTLNRQRP
jgi:hypothetical protein